MWNETIRALLVEDNSDDAELTALALACVKQPTIEVVIARDLKSALRQLRERRTDVVLVDLGLPDCDGIATIERIRTLDQHIPLLVLTGLCDEAVSLASLEHGAQDYLIKGNVTPDSLMRAIRYAMQRQHLVQALMAANELLETKNRRLAALYKTAHRFVDNVSHEFRTPLTVIKEYTSMMREGLLGEMTEEQRGFLDIVGDRTEDLNNMVDDMLDVSRLEAGMLGVRRQVCRVAEIVDRVLPMLQRKAAVKNVKLEVDVDDDLPDVFCDAEKAGRVIINLAINAIKFCCIPGHVRLWVRRDADLCDVLIGIADNGPGINEESRQAIFQRFRQLDTETQSSTKGFGLGLSIAKELVDLNFGKITVESEPERGSTFSFTLPQADSCEIVRRYLDWIAQQRGGVGGVALVRAAIDPATEAAVTRQVDSFFVYLLRQNDLQFRQEACSWLLLLNVRGPELDCFFDRAAKTWQEANRNRIGGQLPPIRWKTLGTFQATDQRDQLLEIAQRELELRETIYA